METILTFDEETHTYTVNGVVKDSVTRRLKGCGAAPDYTGIDPYYADRGTDAHTYCTLLSQGWLDWETVREDCLEYVRTFQRICFEMGLTYISAEIPCYDPEYDTCGKYDLIMGWNGKRTLVELKTGEFEMYHGLQVAWYERMVDVEDVLGISLKNGGKVFGKAVDYQKNHDVLKDINTGFFDHAAWYKDRKRRRMTRIL